MDPQAFARGEVSQEDVAVWRGTPAETLNRIRAKYNLTEDLFSEVEIFELTLRCYHSCPDQESKARAEQEYQNFVRAGRVSLPYYVVRAGDPDVDYLSLHAF